MTIVFQEFPKMGRLSREVVISEKIDGTNAAIVIEETENGVIIGAQSRTRIITPEDDNFGFARWVQANAQELIAGLGVGRHFGEWWGAGIQRKYGLTEKRFSLFNAVRWVEHDQEPWPIVTQDQRAEPKMQQRAPVCCHVVPVLYRSIFSTDVVDAVLHKLKNEGSRAAPGFMNPEGIVAFHIAAQVGFKKTIGDDDGKFNHAHDRKKAP